MVSGMRQFLGPQEGVRRERQAQLLGRVFVNGINDPPRFADAASSSPWGILAGRKSRTGRYQTSAKEISKRSDVRPSVHSPIRDPAGQHSIFRPRSPVARSFGRPG
jgi:hypothetical protein